jgi:hypothetical protein
MRYLAAVLAAFLSVSPLAYGADAGAPASGAAQGMDSSLGGYTSLRLDEAGLFVGGFDGTIDRLSDGVKITLLSTDPSLKPLPISAREMKFSWNKEANSTKPSKILLEGKVAIDHPQATVRAEKADWDLDAGMLVFTGAPVITTEQVPQGIEGQKVVLNFNQNKFEVYGGRAKEIPLQSAMGPGAAPDPNLLREQDIKDWPKFLESIRTQAAADKPSPGKQLVTLLDAKVQKLLTTTAMETLLGDKAAVLKQINKVIGNPKFYNEPAWAGISLNDSTQEMLAQGAKAPMTRLNRSLLSAAYPGIVAAAPEQKN